MRGTFISKSLANLSSERGLFLVSSDLCLFIPFKSSSVNRKAYEDKDENEDDDDEDGDKDEYLESDDEDEDGDKDEYEDDDDEDEDGGKDAYAGIHDPGTSEVYEY